jgi:transcriptional regulator with XRE-family HTH domain
MDFSTIVRKKRMTGYQLSKKSGIPQTTITDLISGKSDLSKCNGLTLYRLSRALEIPMESLMEQILFGEETFDFETFRSDECHLLKSRGDILYLNELYDSRRISILYQARSYKEAYYLLGMADYLCRLHGLPLRAEFDEMRKKQLEKTVYPSDVILSSKLSEDTSLLKRAEKDSIPEFMRYNIVEVDVRNVR